MQERGVRGRVSGERGWSRGGVWILLAACALGVGVVAALGGTAEASPIYKIDYADHDVRMTDNKKVATELTDFGFLMGANILYAKRGASRVDVPFRKISKLEIEPYLTSKGYSPAKVTTTAGKTYSIEIPRFEGRRYVGGSTDFGSQRIQLMNLRKIEFKGLSHLPRTGGTVRP